MSSTAWSIQLDLLIRARTPLIWIRSSEEVRVETLLSQAATRLQSQLISWNFIDGLSGTLNACLLYTSPSPRDGLLSRMPSSA